MTLRERIAHVERKARRIALAADHLWAELVPGRMAVHVRRAGVPIQPGNDAAVRRVIQQDGLAYFELDAAVLFEETLRLVVAEGEDWRSRVKAGFHDVVDSIVDGMDVEDMSAPAQRIGIIDEVDNGLRLRPRMTILD